MGSLPNLSIVKGPTRPLKPDLLHRVFENVTSKLASEKAALIFERNESVEKLSYSELNKLSNRLARVILETASSKKLPSNTDGDFIVAVSMSPSNSLVATLLAIWKAGAAYLPLDPTFPGSRIEHILGEAKPVMVIYGEDSPHFLETYKLSYDELFAQGNYRSSENINNEQCLTHTKDDLAIVLYTSGSTGIPKGVRIPHKIILNRLQWQFKTFPYSTTERTGVFKTALTFVDSVPEIWGPLINGLSVLIVPKSVTTDPEKLVSLLEKYKIERIVLVPSLLRSMLMYLEMQKNKNILRNVRLWVCSGETLVISLANEFFEYFPENEYKLCNFYGSTEIMGDVTYHIISGPNQLRHQGKIPIGLPLDNTIIYLLDSDFQPVKAGDVGELFVSGLNLAAGYVNERDPEKFIENPLAVNPMFARLYRTGDFAKIEKGTIIYEGRTDSQVKIRGHRVDLLEVEKAINSLEEVDKAVVLCYSPGEIDQALLAFVTTNALISENYLEDMLKGKLSLYMVPQVILVENIPLLVNGKTDRQALLKSYENVNNNDDTGYQVDINYRGVPEHKMEAAKILFETIAAVLNRSARSAISLDTNFYDIGGNSLNSIFTITSLNEKGYHISISDFIAAIDLGEVLDRLSKEKEMPLFTQPPSYTIEILKDEHKNDVLDMITTSFYQKADLERWLIPEVKFEDYSELIDALWEPLLEKGLSFVTKNESGDLRGVALNFDAKDEPEIEITSKLLTVFQFLEHIEGPVINTLLSPEKGKVLHCFMTATHSSLSPKENVFIMNFMEDQVVEFARERKFERILTTNTSPLTQQLGTDVYGYETLTDYQVNQFIASDNTKPFGLAPDSQRALVQWKLI